MIVEYTLQRIITTWLVKLTHLLLESDEAVCREASLLVALLGLPACS